MTSVKIYPPSCRSNSSCTCPRILDNETVQALYKKGEQGSNSCPNGYVKIQNPSQCWTAAQSLGITRGSWNGGETTSAGEPGGCMENRDKEVFFNYNSTGTANAECAPICQARLRSLLKYDPRPLHVPDSVDRYGVLFGTVHRRDLSLISHNALPSTLMLAPWNPHYTHRPMLERCSELGLQVIPAFNISAYWQGACGDELCPGVRSRLETDFSIFLHQASYSDENSVQKWTVHPAVLMWNLVGLPELRQLFRVGCVNPSLSARVDSISNCLASDGDSDWQISTVKLLQEVLATVQVAQQKFYCESVDGTLHVPCRLQVESFRPTLLTLGVGKDIFLHLEESRAYVMQTMIWMERVVGCAQLTDLPMSFPITNSQFQATCANEGRGFYDAINIQIATSPDDRSVEGLFAFMDEAFLPPRDPAIPGVDSPGLTFADLGGPMRPAFLEYGFTDLEFENDTLDIVYHKKLLDLVDRQKQTASSAGSCLAGAVVDEWVSQGHSAGVKGLVRQFDSGLKHCISPPPWIQVPDDVALCTPIGWWSVAVWVAVAVIVLFLILDISGYSLRACARCCLKVCSRKKQATLSHKVSCYEKVSLGTQDIAELLRSNPDTREKYQNLANNTFGRGLAEAVAFKLQQPVQDLGSGCFARLRRKCFAVPLETFPSKKDLKLIQGHAGWGLRYKEKLSCSEWLYLRLLHKRKPALPRFEYCRLKVGGNGFISPSEHMREDEELFWEDDEFLTAEDKFIEWLIPKTDKDFAAYGFTDDELNTAEFVANRTITKNKLLLFTQTEKDQLEPISTTVTHFVWNHERDDPLKKPDDAFLDRIYPVVEDLVSGCCKLELSLQLQADYFFRDSSTVETEQSRALQRWYDADRHNTLQEGRRTTRYRRSAKMREAEETEKRADIEAFLNTFVECHLRSQAQKLEEQVYHEKQFVMTALIPESHEAEAPRTDAGLREEAARKAMYNVWSRVLEGCLVCQQTFSIGKLLDTQGDHDFAMLFVQALLLRFLESAGEQLMHCPEYLALVYFDALESLYQEKTGVTDDGRPITTWKVYINFNHLFEPLEEFTRNMNVFNGSSQGISLDDINDAGAAALSAWPKTSPGSKVPAIVKQWHEPIGYWVVVNVVANHARVFRMLLLSVVAAFAYGDMECSQGYTGAPLTFLCTIHLQYRLGHSWDQFKPIHGMILDLIVYLAFFCCEASVSIPWTVRRHRYRHLHLRVCSRDIVRIAVRGVGVLLLLAMIVVCVASEFEAGRKPINEALGLRVASWTELQNTIAGIYFTCCAVYIAFNWLANCLFSTPFLRGSTREHKAPASRCCGQFLILILLLVNLLMTFLLLYPLSRPLFDSDSLCAEVCEPHTAKTRINACLGYVSPFSELCLAAPLSLNHLNVATCSYFNSGLNVDDDSGWACAYSSQCLACGAVVGHVIILTSFGSVIALFFIYYAIVGVAGGAIGYDRGLRYAPIQALSFKEAPQMKTVKQGTKRKEALEVSEGGVMQRVFGSKWKAVWRLILESLHDDCLIDGGAMNKLIQAANENKDVKMKNLGGIVQDRAKRRLDFLFKTFRYIMEEDTFLPYYDEMNRWKVEPADELGGVKPVKTIKPRFRNSEDYLQPTDALAEVFRTNASGKLPTLTQIIPVFGELGMYSMKDLTQRDDPRLPNLLEFLISQFKEEWEIFASQLGSHPTDLYNAVIDHSLDTFPGLQGKLLEWASYRHQTVYRTVDGAVNYHKAVSVLLQHPLKKKLRREDLTPHVQLLLSHQTYGQRKKAGNNPNREKDVRYMLRKYKDYPLLLVLDYDATNALDDLQKLVDDWCPPLPSGRKIRYASILAEYDEVKDEEDRIAEQSDADHKQPQERLPIKLLHVLPRIRSLRLKDRGGSAQQTQGKAANQLGAVRFATGHYFQMMDANMGAFLGETLKVPHVLRQFRRRPYLEALPNAVGDTSELLAKSSGYKFNASPHVAMRVVGFREHVFTRSHGLMGKITADAEWTFGTATQRVLAFVGVRMHYGHPDFVDSFWASNRGSVSKSSPINLSEDIFFGFNVSMRNENSEHTDIVEWEKGREVQFRGAAGLFWKFSSGNVGVMRSRDLRVLTMSASHIYSVPLYFATTAWYVHQVLVDISTELLLQLFMFLALSSKTIQDLGDLGSVLSVEWLVSPGLSSLLPGFLTFGVEFGLSALLFDYIPSIPSSALAFTFINKSVSVAMRATVANNTAEYVNTGRPHANKGYTLEEAFTDFRASHYEPAVMVFVYFFVYVQASGSLAEPSTLPLYAINVMAATWIFAPVIFQPPSADSYWQQIKDLWDYNTEKPISGIPVDGKKTLYDAVMLDEIQAARTRPFVDFLFSLVPTSLYFFCLPAIVCDQAVVALVMVGILFNVFTEFYVPLTSTRPARVLFIVMKGSVLALILITPLVDSLFDGRLIGLGLLALGAFLKTVKCLLLVALNVWSAFAIEHGSLTYNLTVVRISQSFGTMYVHRAAALAVLVLQALLACLLWHLETGSLQISWIRIGPLRLHTWYLFGWDFKPGNVKDMFGEGAGGKDTASETMQHMTRGGSDIKAGDGSSGKTQEERIPAGEQSKRCDNEAELDGAGIPLEAKLASILGKMEAVLSTAERKLEENEQQLGRRPTSRIIDPGSREMETIESDEEEEGAEQLEEAEELQKGCDKENDNQEQGQRQEGVAEEVVGPGQGQGETIRQEHRPQVVGSGQGPGKTNRKEDRRQVTGKAGGHTVRQNRSLNRTATRHRAALGKLARAGGSTPEASLARLKQFFDQRIGDCWASFERLDLIRDGKLSCFEWQQVLSIEEKFCSLQEARELFHLFAQGSDGWIDWDFFKVRFESIGTPLADGPLPHIHRDDHQRYTALQVQHVSLPTPPVPDVLLKLRIYILTHYQSLNAAWQALLHIHRRSHGKLPNAVTSVEWHTMLVDEEGYCKRDEAQKIFLLLARGGELHKQAFLAGLGGEVQHETSPQQEDHAQSSAADGETQGHFSLSSVLPGAISSHHPME